MALLKCQNKMSKCGFTVILGRILNLKTGVCKDFEMKGNLGGLIMAVDIESENAMEIEEINFKDIPHDSDTVNTSEESSKTKCEDGIFGFTPKQVQYVQENFDRIDVDGSGDIDLQECLDAFSWLKYDLGIEQGDPAVLRRLFEVYAEDGVVGVESLLEILAGVKDAIGHHSEYESEPELEEEEKVGFFGKYKIAKKIATWLGFDSDETAAVWKRQNQKAIGHNKLALEGKMTM